LRVQAYRHFAAAQQSAEEQSFEWSGTGAGAAERDRLQAATAEAQAVFLTQLAVASQRPNVAPADIPETPLAGTPPFDAVVAHGLDRIADRAQDLAPGALPDLRGQLDAISGLARAELQLIADPEVALQVRGRLALYRELVPRLERLASGSAVG